MFSEEYETKICKIINRIKEILDKINNLNIIFYLIYFLIYFIFYYLNISYLLLILINDMNIFYTFR